MARHLRLLISRSHILRVIMSAFVILWYVDGFPFLMAVPAIINIHVVALSVILLKIAHNYIVLITGVTRTAHSRNGRFNNAIDVRGTGSGSVAFKDRPAVWHLRNIDDLVFKPATKSQHFVLEIRLQSC
jgi:hypothetical protein